MQSGPEVIKIFFMLNSIEHEVSIADKNIMLKKTFSAFKLSDVVLNMLIYVKMPPIVGILTFMSMISFMLSWVEYMKKVL